MYKPISGLSNMLNRIYNSHVLHAALFPKVIQRFFEWRAGLPSFHSTLFSVLICLISCFSSWAQADVSIKAQFQDPVVRIDSCTHIICLVTNTGSQTLPAGVVDLTFAFPSAYERVATAYPGYITTSSTATTLALSNDHNILAGMTDTILVKVKGILVTSLQGVATNIEIDLVSLNDSNPTNNNTAPRTIITELDLLIQNSISLDTAAIGEMVNYRTILCANNVGASFVAGEVTLAITYPGDGIVATPNNPPTGPHSSDYIWTKSGNTWTGTNIAAIPAGRKDTFTYTFPAILSNLPAGSTFNSTGSFMGNGLREPQDNNTANATVYIQSALEVTCLAPTTIYLNADGNFNNYMPSYFATYTSHPSCAIIPPTFVPALNDLDCTSTGTQTVSMYINDMCNGSDSCSFTLSVIDTFPPVITCPASTTINVGQDCDTLLSIPAPIVSDNCGIASYTRNGTTTVAISGNYGLDTITSLYLVTDFQGNSASCAYTIIIADATSPDLTCDDGLTVSLTDTGSNFLEVDDFIEEVVDNCWVTYRAIKRVQGSCDGFDDDSYDDRVDFCCEDKGSQVMVEVLVRDQAGNETRCSVMVEVSDVLPATLVQPLPSIELYCEYFIDLADLSVFGTIVKNAADRNDIVVVDEHYTAPYVIGQDGYVTDNCPTDDFVITELPPMDNRINNQGTIIRTFTIDDNNPLTTGLITTSQTITVMDKDLLTSSDIIWPADTTIVVDITNGCGITNPSLVDGGFPIINNDDICTMPAIDSTSMLFPNDGNGCGFIMRNWSIIDMSQFIPNTNMGRWTHNQNIKYVNNVAPIAGPECQDKTVFFPNASCEGNISLFMTATDDCTATDKIYYDYAIDLDKDGTVDYNGINDSLTHFMTPGVHLVIWRIEDRCGNLTTCEFDLTVKEGKAPLPLCINGLSIDLNNKLEAEVWAKDFNRGSSDNCTATADLVYSFAADTSVTNHTYYCDDKGVNTVKLFVTDEAGNQSYCQTRIIVTDNLDSCSTTGPLLTHRVGGKITTAEQVPIKDAEVIIKNIANEAITAHTDTLGGFEFANLLAQKDYTVEATKANDCMAGVSTLDLVLIQRHILGVEKFNTPYQYIAADINDSKTISAADMVTLRKSILGINDTMGDRNCWEFIDKNHQFTNIHQPWGYPTIGEVQPLDADLMHTDFTAVKIGDVNGSYSNLVSNSTDPRSAIATQITTPDIVFTEGDLIQVPIKVMKDVSVLGLQMAFTYDASSLQFVDAIGEALDIEGDFYHKIEGTVGHVTLAFAEAQEVRLHIQDVLFNLTFAATKSTKLSNVLTDNPSLLASVLYDELKDIQHIQFDFDVEDLAPIHIGVATPNPFINKTLVPIEVAFAMPIEVKLLDASGRLLLQNYQDYQPGIHYIEISESVIDMQGGVFYLHITGAEYQEVRKLIRIN